MENNWNYRIVKRIWNHPYLHEPTELFEMCEVQYDKDGNPEYLSDGFITEHSVEDIRETLQWMLESLDKPIIEEKK